MATQQQQNPLETRAPVTQDLSSHGNQLWIELEIDRVAGVSCPVAAFENESANGHIQLIGEQCHLSITSEDRPSGEATVITSPIEKSCTCKLVCEPGITPSNLLVENGSLVINAFVKSRERLLELSDRLRESDDEWTLRRLLTAAEHSQAEPESSGELLDEISLTEKQREVVEEAVTRGYYSTPREASLSDLAEELEVTRSALSQRLNAVEAKLIETLAAEL